MKYRCEKRSVGVRVDVLVQALCVVCRVDERECEG